MLRGRCVFKDRGVLLHEDEQSDLTHYAPNCATFSRAREIPIKGVKSCPRPLRSESHPFGIPSEVERMSKRGRKRLADDTEMAELAANRCWERAERGKAFTLEHPGNSLAQFLPSWKRLISRSDVYVIRYHTCRFEGSRRRKFQMLITNRCCFIDFIGKLCEGNPCSRTGESHLKWRPTVHAGQVLQFQTGDEREYPVGFCQEYAKAAGLVLGKKGLFLEVFSGPNAPLSVAVGAELGANVPGCRLMRPGKGDRVELQSLSQLLSTHPLASSQGNKQGAAIRLCSRGFL